MEADDRREMNLPPWVLVAGPTRTSLRAKSDAETRILGRSASKRGISAETHTRSIPPSRPTPATRWPSRRKKSQFGTELTFFDL
jgi:hypothetical protein